MGENKKRKLFNSNSIRQKIVLGFLSIIILNLTIFLGLEIFNFYNQVKEEALDKSYAYAEHIEKVVSPIGIEKRDKLQEKIDELKKQYPLIEYIGVTDDNLKYIANTNDTLVGQSFSNEYTEGLIRINKSMSFSLEENSKINYFSAVPLYKTTGDSVSSVSSATIAEVDDIDGVTSSSTKLNISGLIVVKMDNEAMMTQLKTKIFEMFVVSIIVILTSITIALRMSLGITKPLLHIRDYLKEMALGNLTKKVNIKSKDELGDLATDINSTNDSLKNMIFNVKSVSQYLEGYSGDIKMSSEGIAAVSEEISSTMNSIAENAEVQNNNLIESVVKLREFSNSLEKFNHEITIIEKESKDIKDLADDGANKINYVVNSMNEIKEYFKDVSAGIMLLNSNIAQINSISETITDVAKQTNLLSLNAAIEASRDNQAGNGFGIVANEIKKLAKQTLESSEVITKLIKEISNDSKIVEGTAIKSIEKFEEQSEGITNAIVSFDAIVNQVSSIIPQINGMSITIKDTVDMKDRILDNIQTIVLTSEELSASVEEVTHSVEEQSATLVDLANLSDKLDNTAVNMIKLVESFKV